MTLISTILPSKSALHSTENLFVSTIYNIYPYATKTKKRILEELLERIPDTKYVELLMIKKDIDIVKEVNEHLHSVRDTWKEVMKIKIGQGN